MPPNPSWTAPGLLPQKAVFYPVNGGYWPTAVGYLQLQVDGCGRYGVSRCRSAANLRRSRAGQRVANGLRCGEGLRGRGQAVVTEAAGFSGGSVYCLGPTQRDTPGGGGHVQAQPMSCGARGSSPPALARGVFLLDPLVPKSADDPSRVMRYGAPSNQHPMKSRAVRGHWTAMWPGPGAVVEGPRAEEHEGTTRDALEGKGSQRRSKKRLDRRLGEVAKAVGGGYCRLQMPLKLALGVREQWLGVGWAPWEGGEVPPPLPMHPWEQPLCPTPHPTRAPHLQGGRTTATRCRPAPRLFAALKCGGVPANGSADTCSRGIRGLVSGSRRPQMPPGPVTQSCPPTPSGRCCALVATPNS